VVGFSSCSSLTQEMLPLLWCDADWGGLPLSDWLFFIASSPLYKWHIWYYSSTQRGRCFSMPTSSRHGLWLSFSLKVPKCEIFDPFFFTSVNPIWVGDLRTGEKKIFVRRLRQIFAIFVFLCMLSLR
jgi:hypothetical protein